MLAIFFCCGPMAAPGFVQLWCLLGPRGRHLGSVLAPFGALCAKSGAQTTSKTVFERRRRPREPPVQIRTQLAHPTGLQFGTKFQKICRKAGKKRVFFEHLFFSPLLGRPGRSTAGAHMQSAHACAVETHFSVFGVCSKKPPRRAPLGSSLVTFSHQVRCK